MKIIKKTVHNAKIQTAEKKDILRTAAYCRVSTFKEEQELSYESQCAYYKALIEADPKKTLVGVYGDHGLSGLHAEDRPELQRLLSDCREGKIDLILTKSISRLGRNAAECSRMIEELSALGIPIIFERENLSSNDPQLSLILKLLISMAQEESNSTSQAIKWSYTHNVEKGTPTRGTVYGYRKKKREKRTDPHIWEVYEPEAQKIRLMFGLAAKGKSIEAVLKKLNSMEENGYKWRKFRVLYLLRNEAYKGDILSHKTYKPDMLSKYGVVNKGERTQFYIEGHHEPIVSKKLFDKVQEIIKEW